MTIVELEGYLTENGELKLEHLIELPAGKVKITVESEAAADTDGSEGENTKRIMTLGDLLASGLVGLWKDYGIIDSVEWVNELRRNEEEKRNSWTH